MKKHDIEFIWKKLEVVKTGKTLEIVTHSEKCVTEKA